MAPRVSIAHALNRRAPAISALTDPPTRCFDLRTAKSRAGNMAFDMLHWTNVLAKKMGVEASLGITLDDIIVGVYGRRINNYFSMPYGFAWRKFLAHF